MRDCNFKTSTLTPERLLRASLSQKIHMVIQLTCFLLQQDPTKSKKPPIVNQQFVVYKFQCDYSAIVTNTVMFDCLVRKILLIRELIPSNNLPYTA